MTLLRPPAEELPPIAWFALGLPVVFIGLFFTAPAFALSLGLSFGAALAAFMRRRARRAVPLWLFAPGPAVFAYLLGSFIDGLIRHPEMKVPARMAEGAGEVLLMVFSQGKLPFEGAKDLAPWSWIAAIWLGLALGTGALAWVAQRRQPTA